MSKANLNELAALQFVLNYISVKDLLHFAMNGFAECDDIESQDNADLCSKAINSFLE